VRKINITNWRTPVVMQHNVKGVPYCIVYNREGERVLSSSDACWMIANRPEMLKEL
jgi:hypothetical protein